jgi:hypothetical protein
MLGRGETSYSSWAYSLASEIGEKVSAQAIFNRMNQAWISLLKVLVGKVLKTSLIETNWKSSCKLFKNIYLQDSTTIGLPDCMRDLFPGNYSRGKQKAVAKINTVLNAMTGVCISFKIDSYTTPEQRLSEDIFNIAKAGDLVIRDLGYYVLDAFKKMTQKRIYFISRQKFNVSIFNSKTHRKLSLVKLLRNKCNLDINVLCGNNHKVPVRFIAIKLSDEEAFQRIRKARKNRDKRLNHSAEYYASLHYKMFITNAEESMCSAQQIAEFYRLRWQIETVFKSWKSGIKIETLIPKAQIKTERIEAVIYMMILYIAWFEQKIVKPINDLLSKEEVTQISPYKLSIYILKDLQNFLAKGILPNDLDKITYFCSYETRQRINARQRLTNLLNEFG